MARNPKSKRNSPTVLILIVLLAAVSLLLSWFTGRLEPEHLPESFQGYVEGDLWVASVFLAGLLVVLTVAVHLLTQARTKSEPTHEFTPELRLTC